MKFHNGDPVTANDVLYCFNLMKQYGTKYAYYGIGGLPNQVKSFTRTGMGPCQGRMCALTVSEVIADQLGKSMAEVGTYRVRFPIKPLTVGELASLE